MTEHNPPGPDDDLLAAEYVLGVLPHAERLALARRIEGDRVLAARVRFWDERLSPLSDAVEPVDPPPAVLASIERRLFPPAAAGSPGLWQSLAFWRSVSAVLCGVLLIAGLLLMTPRFTPQPDTGLVAEIGGTGEALRLAAYYDAKSGTLRLNRVAGAPQANRDFELWLIVGNQAPVSLGTLPPQAMTALGVAPEIAAKFASGAVLAVSDEPSGGSPTGQPTGPVLATGELSAI